MGNKLDNHKKSFPSPYYRKKADNNIEKLLSVIAQADEEMSTEIKNGRDQRFLMSAEGKYLTNFGSRFKTERPQGFRMSEAVYRELVRIMGFERKQIYSVFAQLAKLFWGERALIDQIVQIYNVEPSKIEILIDALAPIIAARRDLINATYLHENHDLAPTFPSAYTYEIATYSTLSADLHVPGQSYIKITINADDFPIVPFVIAIGDPNTSTYETKYVTGRVGTTLSISSVLKYNHSAGENVYIPIYPRNIQTTLNQIITAGHSYNLILLNNSANLPDNERAIWIAYNRQNREIVPTRSRTYNDRIEIDSSYVFKNSYGIGQKVTLCATKPFISKKGLDYHFKLTDTDQLQAYVVELFRRVKKEAVRLSVTFE